MTSFRKIQNKILRLKTWQNIFGILLFGSFQIAFGQNNPDNKIDAFKSFLADRPVVKNITFCYSPTISKSLFSEFFSGTYDASKMDQTHCANGSWQPNQFLMKSSVPQRINSEVVIGFNKDEYWQISGGIVTIFKDDDETNAYADTLTGLLDTLNFGIPLLREHSLTWNNLDFSALSRDGNPMHGTLSIKNEKPDFLDCFIEGYKWSYRITYSFSNDLAQVLPSQYEVAIKREGHADFESLTSVRITSLETASEKLPNDIIEPYQGSFYAKSQSILVSNGVRYVRLNGQFGRPYVKASVQAVHHSTLFARLLVGVVFVTPIFALIYLRLKRKKQT